MTFNRLLKTAVATGLLCAAGCASDFSPAYVTGFFPLAADATCSADFTADATLRGTLDTSAAQPLFRVGVRLENVLVAAEPASREGDGKELSQDANTLVFDRIQFDFRTSEGATFSAPASRTIAIAAVVKPTESANISMPLLTPELIEAAGLANKEGGDLITKLTFLGRSVAGEEIQAQAIEFPVTLCAGCLACPDGMIANGCNPAQSDGRVCELPETEP